MAATATATCRIDQVTKTFGRTRALDRISLDLSEGITGLLGPNGAGKTTLLTLLATIQTPDHGHVELLGRTPDTSADRIAIRRRLGYMPQEPGFHRRFTVFDFIDYVAILKEMTDTRQRHDEVRRVIDLVGLNDQTGTRIKALSGGMRRRVALAQALLGNPDLLLLDEPTAGLDPERRLQFRDLVSRLGEDRTVVLSTHQTEDVAALCTDVVVMDRGTTHFQGTPRQLSNTAQGQVFTAKTRLPAQLAYRTGDGHYRHVGPDRSAIPPGGEPAEPTIEDAYLLLVGETQT